jgi:pimeloyl-ACP methyl ester carboxylesterase
MRTCASLGIEGCPRTGNAFTPWKRQLHARYHTLAGAGHPTATVREIDGAAHAVMFDSPHNFVRVIVEAIRSSEQRDRQTA